MDALSKALADQDDQGVIKDILEDIFTKSELEEISQRVAIARLLKEGRDYRSITEETGASSATIARVSERVKYGFRGYDYF